MAYSNSPLVAYTRISPNKTSPRNHAIDRISIHCVVGQCTAEALGSLFAASSKKASSNYGVDKNGRVGMYVEEKDRSWCTSSAANDHRAVTIETASDTTHPYAVNAAAYATLLDLCEDICRRNGKKKLLWFGDKETTLNYAPASDEMVLTVHRWFANKACPGEYLYSRHSEIASEVTNRLSEGASETSEAPAKYIWDYFLEKLGNKYGVAGLMGNLYAESGLYPDRVQGDVPYSSYSQEYTAKIDNGLISESDFVNNGPNGGGYGLAQWTYYTRKQGLYDLYKSGGYSSIGSVELACDYLWYELQNSFAGVLDVLKSAKSIKEASDKVLHDFESPADQSSTVESNRASYGRYYYNLYADATPDNDPATGGNADFKIGKLSKFLLFAAATQRN